MLWDHKEQGSIMGHWADLLLQEFAEQDSFLVNTKAAALRAWRLPAQDAPFSQDLLK